MSPFVISDYEYDIYRFLQENHLLNYHKLSTHIYPVASW
ncbi:hypothetical protein JOC48_003936 [Aquibacillus albus]|uniref:Uncharacterized protein n=1 Tax=Aquibacillus albus TaxID=1168171 RepID=A0ABS2N5H7_9BACI|nr:hypothetical protein [Aquibacillus albus]